MPRSGSRNQRERDAAQARESEQRAPPVDARRGARSKLSGDNARRSRSRQREEWIDQKDHVPGEVVDDPAAEQGHRRRDGRKSRPGPDGPAALGLGEGGADDRERAGDEQRGADALHGARRDQLIDVGRKAAPDRGGGEDRDPGDEDAARPS